MIQRWNEIVKPEDVVYHLGDFAWSNHAKHLKALNGQKVLLLGNHDKVSIIKNLDWQYWTTYAEMEIKKTHFVMFHYPIVEWNRYYHGSIDLHGHQHNHEPWQANNRIDVGVDAHDFRPWSIDELLKLVDKLGHKQEPITTMAEEYRKL